MNSDEFRKAAHSAVDESMELLLLTKDNVWGLIMSQSLITSTLFKIDVSFPMSNQVISANCYPPSRQIKEKTGRTYKKTSKRRSCPV